jgi:hypothetical protein
MKTRRQLRARSAPGRITGVAGLRDITRPRRAGRPRRLTDALPTCSGARRTGCARGAGAGCPAAGARARR